MVFCFIEIFKVIILDYVNMLFWKWVKISNFNFFLKFFYIKEGIFNRFFIKFGLMYFLLDI